MASKDLLCAYLPTWGRVENVCEILMMESKKSLRETQIQSLKLQNVAGQGPKLQTYKNHKHLPSPCLFLLRSMRGNSPDG